MLFCGRVRSVRRCGRVRQRHLEVAARAPRAVVEAEAERRRVRERRAARLNASWWSNPRIPRERLYGAVGWRVPSRARGSAKRRSRRAVPARSWSAATAPGRPRPDGDHGKHHADLIRPPPPRRRPAQPGAAHLVHAEARRPARGRTRSVGARPRQRRLRRAGRGARRRQLLHRHGVEAVQVVLRRVQRHDVELDAVVLVGREHVVGAARVVVVVSGR